MFVVSFDLFRKSILLALRIVLILHYQRIEIFPSFSNCVKKVLVLLNSIRAKPLVTKSINFMGHTWCLIDEVGLVTGYGLVWSLNPFYSVDLSQSRISVNSEFLTNAQSRFAISDGVIVSM